MTVFVVVDGVQLAVMEEAAVGMDTDTRFSGGGQIIQNMPMYVIPMQIVQWVRVVKLDFALCKKIEDAGHM
jgi:hypothetical protein